MKIQHDNVASGEWRVTGMERARCPVASHSAPAARSAFTMIEIALCLAIIGFALVAIIGVLPTGLNVQRDNREETIVNQDAVVWMNSIRNGAQGFDDLTNYVLGITNYWTVYEVTPTQTNIISRGADQYDRANSVGTSQMAASTGCGLTNGFRIIGLLSTPTYVPSPPPPGGSGTYQSNYVIAVVRAFSGAAIEKAPQNNDTILDAAFTYKLIVENFPYIPVEPGASGNSVNQMLQTNAHDLRLTFRWPYFIEKKDVIGNGRQTFRMFTGGWINPTNDPVLGSVQRLFFIQPDTYL
jgi:type II secretory pathway pseudopilin PulG